MVPTENPDAAKQYWNVHIGGTATAGIAGPTASPADLHRCYREATSTMHALLTLGRTGTIATAEELGIYRILLTHAGRRELQTQFDEPSARSSPNKSTATYRCWPRSRHFSTTDVGRTHRAMLDIDVKTLYQRIAVLDRLLGAD